MGISLRLLLALSDLFLMLQNDSAELPQSVLYQGFSRSALTRLFFSEVQDLVQRFVLRVNFLLKLGFQRFLFLDFYGSALRLLNVSALLFSSSLY